jgi:signal transduction histidine kinase
VSRVFRLLAITVVLAMGSAAGQEAGAGKNGNNETNATLTTAREVRALSAEKAAKRVPVRLRAVVTFVEPRGSVFLYDGAGATFAAARGVLRFPAALDLHPGQMLELEGVSYPGLYVPGIEVQRMKITGAGELPPARPVTFEQLASGQFNYEWVEVSGIVRGFHMVDDQAEMTLALGGGRLEILLNRFDPAAVTQFIDATVRVQGLAAGFINEHRQLVEPHLRIPDLSAIHVEEPAPVDPFAIEATPAAHLLRFDPNGSPGHRVKVRGVVTHQVAGEAVFLRDGKRGLRVQTAQNEALRPGDIVETLGFPEMGTLSAVLRDAVFRRVGREAGPAPVVLTMREILPGGHDADLVQVEADLLDALRGSDDLVLLLRSGETLFRARLNWAASAGLRELRSGSRLRLTGVAVAEPTDLRGTGFRANPHSFILLLRGTGDIEVLRAASWWTPPRLAALLGAVFLAAIGAFVWAATLRRRVARQTAIIARKMKAEAATEERERIAREFHDTLEQELVGLMLRLDAAAARTAEPKSRSLLDETRRLVHNIQRGARSLVCNLRQHVLEIVPLTDAISGAVADLETGRKIEVRTEGEPRSLPGLLSHELLRIAQEAATNAVKHGGAGRIEITLAFAPGEVRLRIEDDGCGFNPAQESGKPGHFGLLGMRERVQKLGGRLKLDSHPGQGAVIEVEAPAGAPGT